MFPSRARTDVLLQNRYRVIRPLGRGGMGAVYEAFDARLSRAVALKETFGDTDELRRAFEREAHLLGNLRHPALPKVLDHFEEGDGMFLVMEFIPGEDLGRMLDAGRTFNPDDVLRWADQLLDALEYLHSSKPPVLHRDIKPANLKSISPGQIVLLDFGLAKGAAGQMADTEIRSLLGYSPNYSALEQIQGAGTGPRSDLYSLGATLYNLITGVRPPDAVTRATAIVNGQTDPLRPVSEVKPEVTDAVAAALMRAMALDIERRPASASEMREELHGVAPRVSATVPLAEADEVTRLATRGPARGVEVWVSDDEETRVQRRENPALESEETRVRKRGRGERIWIAGTVVAVAGVLLASIYFLYLADRQTILIAPPETAVQSPGPVTTPELLPNANAQPADLSVEPTLDPGALTARGRLAQRGIPFSEESFTRIVNDGNSSAVDLFLEGGMDPNVKDTQGRPVLLNAAAKGSDEITRRLVSSGADVNAADGQGATPLMEATRRAHRNTVRILLGSGADSNRMDRDGRTALMRAAAEGHDTVVKMLLERGARADLKDKQGRDASMWAEMNGHSGVAELLRRNGRR